MMDGNDNAFPKLGMDGYGDSFPVGEMYNGETAWVEHRGGLTKREMFAAMAMQGMLANFGAHDPKEIAADAIAHADALLEAL